MIGWEGFEAVHTCEANEWRAVDQTSEESDAEGRKDRGMLCLTWLDGVKKAYNQARTQGRAEGMITPTPFPQGVKIKICLGKTTNNW